MKTSLGWALAPALLVGSFASSYAADLPLKARPMAAAVASWTGYYIGVNGGYAGGQDRIDVNPTLVFGNAGLVGGTAFGAASAAAYTNRSGNTDAAFLGGQAGYNWQIAPAWIVGLEADIQGFWTINNRSLASLAPPAGFPANPLSHLQTFTDKVDALATFRGRTGALVSPNLLLYVTGGLAVGDVKAGTTITQQVLGPSALPNAYTSVGYLSEVRVGWVAGAGVEWMTKQPWSIKLEGLYYDLGSRNFASSPLQNFNNVGTLFTSSVPVSHVNFNGYLLRAGINWHFNGPVVARY